MSELFKYDFGLSFAGKDRHHAEKLANIFKSNNIRVFYDFDEQAQLWGEDLYLKFWSIYGRECRYFIPFISADYVQSLWAKHELHNA